MRGIWHFDTMETGTGFHWTWSPARLGNLGQSLGVRRKTSRIAYGPSFVLAGIRWRHRQHSQRSPATFGDVCDRYLTEYFGKIDTPDGPRWTGRRPQTGQDAWYHLNIVRKVIVPAGNGQRVRLEQKLFTAVSTFDVRTVQSERRSHGATGCSRLMARLRHLFNWSIAEGMIDHTPFKRGDVTLVKLDTHAERERTRRLQP